MTKELEGHRIAVLAADGVELTELTEPRRALEQAGAKVDLVSPATDRIQALKGLDRAETFPVNRRLAMAAASDYDALVLPGGVASSDRLRMDSDAVRFVREFFAERKSVAAIGHGPWLLVEADLVRHRNVTSWPSLKTDICNAGGCWTNEQVQVDDSLVTGRGPDDLPAFCSKMIERFAEGAHTHHARVAASSRPGSEKQDAAVEVASEESFPASDAPSSLQVT
jgi:protease I